MVDQFSIGEIYSSTSNTRKSTRYTINIHMTRNFTNQILRTFIPTLILWLFGYATLFIDMSDFSNRFMGAGTCLLVMETRLAAIASDLPKTSYMKFIDIWFLWHNISILSMIFYHVILKTLRVHLERLGDEEVRVFSAIDWMVWNGLDRIKAMHQGNNIVIIAFPILNVLFYGMYFYFNMYH